MVLGAVAVTALTTWTFTRLARAPPSPVTRTSVVLPPAQRRTNFGRRGIAISPSGTHFVYVANNQLYLRAFDELGARPMAGSEQTVARRTLLLAGRPVDRLLLKHVTARWKRLRSGAGPP